MTRLKTDQLLAKFSTLDKWSPKVSDFIVYHALIWSNWYGIIRIVNDDELIVITEGLPKLLFTTPINLYDKNSIKCSVSEIKSSSGGKYAVLQDGVWFVD